MDSLRELNTKFLAEIAELRKENANIPELEKKFADVEAEKMELRQELKARTDYSVKIGNLNGIIVELMQLPPNLNSRMLSLKPR